MNFCIIGIISSRFAGPATQRKHGWNQVPKTDRPILQCAVCSANFTSQYAHATTCSRECSANRRKSRMAMYSQRRRDAEPEYGSRIAYCSDCGLGFKTTSSGGLCEACKVRRKEVWSVIRRLDGELRRIERAIDRAERLAIRLAMQSRSCKGCTKPLHEKGARMCPDCRRIKKRSDKTHTSRARRYGCERETVINSVVFDRNGWLCQQCGCECIKPDGDWNPRWATLDHIVPLSRGGSHTYANTQLLCSQCNTAKSDSVVRGVGAVVFSGSETLHDRSRKMCTFLTIKR